jgi:hypothetical protein
VRDPLQKVHEGILRLLASITIFDMSQEYPKSAEEDLPKTAAKLYGLETPAPKYEQ